MFKQKMTLEVKGGNERIHTFTCDPESPLGEVYDVLSVMISHVISKIEETKKNCEDKEECCASQEKCEKSSKEVKDEQKS